jgi:hypothetical protein
LADSITAIHQGLLEIKKKTVPKDGLFQFIVYFSVEFCTTLFFMAADPSSTPAFFIIG